MNGTIIIRDTGGGVYTLENKSHELFMEYRRLLQDCQDLLVVKPNVHWSLNHRHILLIEWRAD